MRRVLWVRLIHFFFRTLLIEILFLSPAKVLSIKIEWVVEVELTVGGWFKILRIYYFYTFTINY